MLGFARDEAVDALTSLALYAQGLDAIIQPAVSRVVPERPWYPGESRY